MIIKLAGIINFPFLKTPRKNFNGKEEYSVLLMIAKYNMKDVAKHAGIALEELEEIVKDGDSSDNEKLHGYFYINATSQYQPKIVDRECKSIDAEELKAGNRCICRISLKEWSFMGKSGKKCYLQGIQKVNDGIDLFEKNEVENDFMILDEEDIELPFS